MGTFPSAVKATLAFLAIAHLIPSGGVARYRDQNTIIWPQIHLPRDRDCIQHILRDRGNIGPVDDLACGQTVKIMARVDWAEVECI